MSRGLDMRLRVHVLRRIVWLGKFMNRTSQVTTSSPRRSTLGVASKVCISNIALGAEIS